MTSTAGLYSFSLSLFPSFLVILSQGHLLAWKSALKPLKKTSDSINKNNLNSTSKSQIGFPSTVDQVEAWTTVGPDG